ncbi:ABC transporter ATP-binding protein [Aestuariivirga sp.]|uniref:ABC transporter ATP-binding protein n=1 Tax=Aestuariivirga sp. TaxID=2650926 RepID=UPI0035B040BE
MAEALLSTEGLTRRFSSGGGLLRPGRSMTAVRNVTISVPRGSVTGVVGESGCGKSTLARLVLRLIEPSEGSVRFKGVDLTSQPPGELRRLRRHMQMVFQDPYSSLDPRYTIAEVLAEPFRVQGERVSRTELTQLLSQVGLAAEMAAAYPHQLSGGQRQRVGVARALAMRPDFVVLDEPTASLDVSIQAQIVALLERLKSELGLTYLFISHDLGLVRYFCDRILVMYLGSVVEELPSTETTPRHPYTRALLDSTFSPDPSQRRRLVSLSGEIPSPFDLPRGCAFAGRCPLASARCREEQPVLEGAPGEHRVACFHPQ